MAAGKKQSGKDAMAVINEHIKNESYAPVYLLYGDETYLVNQYRDKLLSAVTDREDNMNFAKFAGEKIDPMEIIGFCETMPFFADRRVVLAEGTGLFKKSCEEFAERIKELPQFLKTYQINRILGHIYGSEYGASSDQQDNSVMAIGSGQLSGKGINNSTVATVKDTNLISEQQTDFIFSAVGEELGFIGSVIIIAILCLIVLQCIRVARHAKDKKGMYIATGIGALVVFQTFINIGVATALLPNTGLPLPFISYGLSSLVSMSAGIGLVLNINLQKKKY